MTDVYMYFQLSKFVNLWNYAFQIYLLQLYFRFPLNWHTFQNQSCVSRKSKKGKWNKKSYYMFKHVIIGGVMKLVGIEASKN